MPVWKRKNKRDISDEKYLHEKSQSIESTKNKNRRNCKSNVIQTQQKGSTQHLSD
jgi:hypothetical protein